MFDAADIKDLNENMNMDIINVVDVEDVNLRKCRGQIKEGHSGERDNLLKGVLGIDKVLHGRLLDSLDVHDHLHTALNDCCGLLPSLLTGLLAALNVRSGLLAALSVHGKLVAALGVDSGLLEGPDSWLALQWWTWKTGQGSFAVCKLSSLTCTSENVEQRFSTIESTKKRVI